MTSINAWGHGGGCPPWRGVDSEGLAQAIVSAAFDFRNSVKQACAKPLVANWAGFSALEKAWGDFDSVYRLCHGCAMIGLGGAGESLKVLAEQVYESVWKLWSCSSGLRSLALALGKKKSMPVWQKKSISSSGMGTFAHERPSNRHMRVRRQLAMANLAKACSSNIDSSLERLPVWTNNKKDLVGLPAWLVKEGRERARARQWTGWVFQANYREYSCFMSSAGHRPMRQAMYKARSKAGSEFVAGCDNRELAKKLLAVRKAEARACGYDNYADYCASQHMIDSAVEIERLLLNFAGDATMHAVAERLDLEAWMRETQGVARLEPWDYRYARRWVQEAASGGAMAASQAYFAPITTIERCVGVAAKMLGVGHKRRRSFERDDLMVFEIIAPGRERSFITIVPLARRESQDFGPCEWGLSSRLGTRDAGAASMIFLQMNGQQGGLANLTHDQVVVLFHELGHAFHSVLSLGRSMSESAAEIEGDAMELHSQILEMLAWEPEVLRQVGRCKGKKMPWAMARTLSALRNFHAGSWTIAQVTDALCDIRLHHQFNPRGRLKPWEVMIAIKKEVGLDTPKTYNRQGHQVNALVGSSYVCGDYTYLWSEGMARQVFEKGWIESKGLKSSVGATGLRAVFFDKGSRISTKGQIRRYLGSEPTSGWLSQSRGFK